MSNKEIGDLRRRVRASCGARQVVARLADEVARLAEPYVTLYAPGEWSVALDEGAPQYAHLPNEFARSQAALADYRRHLADTLPPGASRFGGVPDLPPGLAWPTVAGRKAMFLSQIDLSALPRWDGDPLPADGWLYAFALFPPAGGAGDPPWRVSVLHHRGPRDALVRAPRPAADEIWGEEGQEETTYQLVPVHARLGLTHDPATFRGPELEDAFSYAAEAVEEAAPLYNRPEDEWEGAGYLLGHPAPVDGSATEQAHVSGATGDDWTSLLTLLNVGSMYWGDAGRLYVLIRRAALARADFTDVRLSVGCS